VTNIVILLVMMPCSVVGGSTFCAGIYSSLCNIGVHMPKYTVS